MTKVSIIIPVYNTEKYLKKCLGSLINQSLEDIEIICIDDGSKDNSLKILQDYASKDNRIKIIKQENKGCSIAKNAGIQFAKGEFIGFVDSDDWVDIDYFEKLYNAAKKYDCDIACCGYKRCNKIKNSIKLNYATESVYSDIDSKLHTTKIPAANYMWNKIYNREKFLNTGILFPESRVFEDVATLIKIVYHLGKLVTVPNTYYYYRITPNSIITGKSPKKLKDQEWANAEQRRFAKEHNIVLEETKNFTRREYIKLFNITVLKIYYYDNVIKYKLFGFIPFLTKITC